MWVLVGRIGLNTELSRQGVVEMAAYPQAHTAQPPGFWTKLRPGLYILYAALMFWAVVELFPILFMFVQSLKTDAEIMGNIWALPSVPQVGNFIDVWNGGTLGVPIGRYFVNSVIVTGGTLILLMLTGSLAGYALARF